MKSQKDVCRRGGDESVVLFPQDFRSGNTLLVTIEALTISAVVIASCFTLV